MATVIRFSRHGSKKRPYFRMVVQDSRSPRDGRFIEHIGGYNPTKSLEDLQVSRERLLYWLGVGAQMSTSVLNRVQSRLKEWNAAPATTTASVASEPAAQKAAGGEKTKPLARKKK